MPTFLGLRIDVDTYVGAREGLPRLLDTLQQFDRRATVFVPGGPDRTLLALRRVFTQRGYLEKLLRTGAFRVYGPAAFSTWLRRRDREILRAPAMARVLAENHEVAAHGFVHTQWHNDLQRMDAPEIARHVQWSVDAVRKALGVTPAAFGGPGWQANFASLHAVEKQGLVYASDTRGTSPFLPEVHGYAFRTPQVPTTLPSLDELAGGLPPSDDDVRDLLRRIERQEWPVYAAHAELEGRFYTDFFRRLLEHCTHRGIIVVPLGRLLEARRSVGPLPRCNVVQGTVPYRPGSVAMQSDSTRSARRPKGSPPTV